MKEDKQERRRRADLEIVGNGGISSTKNSRKTASSWQKKIQSKPGQF
jgi:hypothetical protein